LFKKLEVEPNRTWLLASVIITECIVLLDKRSLTPPTNEEPSVKRLLVGSNEESSYLAFKS